MGKQLKDTPCLENEDDSNDDPKNINHLITLSVNDFTVEI